MFQVAWERMNCAEVLFQPNFIGNGQWNSRYFSYMKCEHDMRQEFVERRTRRWTPSILSFGGVCRFTTNFRNWRKKIRDVRKSSRGETLK